MGPLTRSATAILAAPVRSGTFTTFTANENKSDLAMLRDWMQRSTLRSVIDRVYPFAELTAALTYQEAGRSRGKVIVKMP